MSDPSDPSRDPGRPPDGIGRTPGAGSDDAGRETRAGSGSASPNDPRAGSADAGRETSTGSGNGSPSDPGGGSDETVRDTDAGSGRTTGGGSLPKKIGNYVIRRQIASGGMGTVYEAIQEQPRRSVAIKVMRSGMFSEAGLHRFAYEAQLLARLRHPGVAQIYEAGTHYETGMGHGAGTHHETGLPHESGTHQESDPHHQADAAIPFFAMEYIPNAKSITAYGPTSRTVWFGT